MKSGIIRRRKRLRPLGCSRPSICTRSSLTSIPPIPPIPPPTLTLSQKPPGPPGDPFCRPRRRLFLRSLEEPLFEPVAERLVEGIWFHGLGDAAAGSYSVQLVHEDNGPAVALRELARLGEQAHDLEVAYPHEHAGEARGRGVDKGHVHLAGYRLAE